MPSLFLTVLVAGVALLAAPAGAQAEPIAPDTVDGLVAWYDARALYDNQRDRAPVSHWPDTSGNGHDLTEEGNGLPSVFRTLQLNDKPAIQIGKHSTFLVANPFPLADHTIVLVYRANKPTLGLFSAARDEQIGIIVARDGKQHQIQRGTRQFPYNATGVGPDFSITVLSRAGARLRAFVDGVEVSGKAHDDTPLEVGRLFHVALSRSAARDAEGLRLADLIFYNRELSDAERDGVTLHLAEKYALELREPPPPEPEKPFDWSNSKPQATLATSSDADLNSAILAVTWDKPERLAAPFRFDADAPTRLYCDRETRVHLSARLWLQSTTPGSELRLLLLQNEEIYHADEATTTPDPGEPAGTRLVGRLDVSLHMRAGDWVEIVTMREGGDGAVVAIPAKSVLLAIAD